MKTRRWTVPGLAAVGLMLAGPALAGSLSPTNAPGSTMHTLEDIYQKLLSLEQRQLVLESQQSPAGMVLIPVGVNAGTDPAFGPYRLTNASAFYMDKYEVTKEQWDAVRAWAAANGYTDLATGGGKSASHPVQTVTWYDCVKWCNARSEKESREAVYYRDAAYTSVYKTGTVSGVNAPYVKASANGYRLPTDVQWTYAARGGATSRRYAWSDTDTIQHARANYYSSDIYYYDTSPTRGGHPSYTNDPQPYTSPAGSFAPNGYGLCDMVGNVSEWCFDWYPGSAGSLRVLHGGGWDSLAGYCWVAFRRSDNPAGGDSGIGFRATRPLGPAVGP